jgi:hypothetical protein
MKVEADRAQTTTELCYTCQFLKAFMFTASSLQDVSSTKGVVARPGEPASGGKIILPVVQPTLVTEVCKQLQQALQ